MRVLLTWLEVAMAAEAGIRRQLLNLEAGTHDAHRFEGDGWGAHIDGCLSEMALAKARDAYWVPVARNPKELAGDVGVLQARSTRHRTGRLRVHDDDADDAWFYLAIGPTRREAGLEYEFMGAMLGRDAKQRRYWCDPTGKNRWAYFVPQADLVSVA